MAIINSTVMGKSKGKIGNVVTTVLKGQVIAKSRNYHPANPKTAGQVSSRGKMSNAVKAWQYLAIFLGFISAHRKSTESNYNAFVRISKNFFSDIVADSASLAASMLSGYSLFLSNFVNVVSIASGGTDVVVTFATDGTPWNATYHLRMILFDRTDGRNKLSDRAITEAEWLAGTLTVITGDDAISDGMVYFYATKDKKCSNILCI